jgi:hypothetical protein
MDADEWGSVWTNDKEHCSVQWINLDKRIRIHRLLQILWMKMDEYMDGERLICCMIVRLPARVFL